MIVQSLQYKKYKRWCYRCNNGDT